VSDAASFYGAIVWLVTIFSLQQMLLRAKRQR